MSARSTYQEAVRDLPGAVSIVIAVKLNLGDNNPIIKDSPVLCVAAQRAAEIFLTEHGYKQIKAEVLEPSLLDPKCYTCFVAWIDTNGNPCKVRFFADIH
ncbi:MAG: hypothetical protein UU40_C0001G0017 [Candidatus Uhrbacteria bacterium GW2011_GWD2_41_121]|uniref:Uncharacterized protein n=1 Tax=Candidatus Uhrbacteria bacterium GW2011_GWC1_41_20 TaxID=1618983 RepID=A0A0G0VGN7_9BACT|nr:MAG: hypothetical protein UT52_C0001G0052 [Candidatus Uhrbacteria bacterium GW2011_GWE1_39_46]KKR64440.1 MAG: hypothetical protein UU04_C0002G0052 [Candidatus Uhrbacteria bacterium GW2011_GWC2_40_450]KKR90680.1 MAG: hypothetical protein UU40_C0001G0017 [Candidatus Uhrbacteria bacterium GW2011_GWD2_41_121]KKR96602.1 MAG: hypothetical protein UU46_C0001G0052 [Candidatus Uhrbacteria bacterium GW2011_GWD1_41_16]KKR99993.1 MAG: hypothetical protein UU50_C0001G0052 [Candidatus Uhrbacteria bacteriu